MTPKLKPIQYDNQPVFPSKIVCIGRNYVEHIHELGNEIPQDMVVFIKPNSSISDGLISFQQEPLHYESEICFMVQNNQFVAVGFGLDLTKRTLQAALKSKGLPWERAKAFDGSAVFSPFQPISRINPTLSVTLHINGKPVQSGSVSQMIYKPDQILCELQSFMTLNDGDIVMTGTPKGVGVIKPGDVYHGAILEQDSTITEAEWKAN